MEGKQRSGNQFRHNSLGHSKHGARHWGKGYRLGGLPCVSISRGTLLSPWPSGQKRFIAADCWREFTARNVANFTEHYSLK